MRSVLRLDLVAFSLGRERDPMKVTEISIPGLRVVEPDVHSDSRGALAEIWHEHRYAEAGIHCRFVQENLSRSRPGVLRGLHLQHPNVQGKLITVLSGEIFDVAVDVRRGSPTFGRWDSVILSAHNRRQFWIPEGFAHGFCVTGDSAVVVYKLSACHDPACEITIAWNDPALAIAWPVRRPVLSDRDRAAPALADIDPVRLPPYERCAA
jgi:dTDP-4-dehydrorhamnose 3,5-epimerase